MKPTHKAPSRSLAASAADNASSEQHVYRVEENENPDRFSLIDLCSALLLLIFWIMSESVLASSEDSPIQAYSSLWLEIEDNGTSSRLAAMALSTTVDIEISGPILRSTVRQTFKNTSQSWAEGMYTFPLPENAAVDTLKMIVGEQIIEGQIQEKTTALRTYQKAKSQGQRASLLNQHQANVFTTSVANIAPDSVIEVEFEYQQFLDYSNGTYSLRFPMVSTPKYTPPASLTAPGFTTPINHYRRANEAPGNPVEISVFLDAGVPVFSPQSKSHRLDVSKRSETSYAISVEGSASTSDRDFLLTWKIKQSDEPLVSILKEEAEGSAFGMLMVVPPMADATASNQRREVVFVLDVSGSMSGESIVQAKSALNNALEKLRSKDLFNLIWFNNQSWQLFPQAKPATRANIASALNKIESLNANGGTEMLPALTRALNPLPSHSSEGGSGDEVLRQLIFITDGAVSNESELFTEIERNLGDSRLFTVGIGSAPNSYFMRRAARSGRGTFTFVSRPSEVEEKMSKLLEQLSSPALTNLELDFQGYRTEVLPTPVPDLYQGEPIYVVFKADLFPEHVSLSGDLDGVSSWLRVDLNDHHSSSGIAKEWARRKIEQLLAIHRKANADEQKILKAQVIEVAKAHSQVSPFTSLVAVDVTPVRAGADLVSERIPANRPKGWQEGNHGQRSAIRLAQTSANAPWYLALGIVLLIVSITGLRWQPRRSA